MRVLIADQSCLVLMQLRRRLALCGIEVAHQTDNLASIYDYSEHQRPDCVILSAELADYPEFEQLASLFAIMGIGCLLLETVTKSTVPAAVRKANPAVRLLPALISDAELNNAVRQTRAAHRPALLIPPQGITAAPDPRAIILIGSSTGGIDALMQVLRHFGPASPPTVVVQHTGGQFAESLIRLLASATRASVVPADHQQPLRPGHIYLAASDRQHIRLSSQRPLRLCLDDAPRLSGHRPSIDALFQSAVTHAAHVTAALLTGMGRDGATGIAALRAAGARTIGQDEDTCVVYGMPRIAKELGGIEAELPIDKIGPALLRGQAPCRS